MGVTLQGIDLFAGAGGMSLGAQMAGVNILHAVEFDIHAANTYKKNHPETVQVFADDIRNFRIPSLKRKEPLIIFGGPPCQGFSTSNQKTRNLENPNNWLFLEFVRIVRELKPDWVVFENVRGILETENGLFVEQTASEFKKLGYTVQYKLLNAADFGVPQKRFRFFMVCSLHGIDFDFPEADITNFVTVKEALHDLPILSNGASVDVLPYRQAANTEYAKLMRGRKRKCSNHLVTNNSTQVVERYKFVPQGGNWENIPLEMMGNYKDRTRCHTKIYHRLEENAPSTVIGNFRKNMLIHPKQNRGLSVREAARLQSFPDWFEFSGSIGYQQQQVGNSVPPLLAKAIFEKIMNY